MEFEPAFITEFAVTYGLKLLSAIATLLIGLYIVKVVVTAIGRIFDRGEVDPSLRSFLGNMISILLKIMVCITALGMMGVEMTSLIAIMGAAGLAGGMARSGTLQNFAGGVMILLFKPYKVGDFIEAQGYSSSV